MTADPLAAELARTREQLRRAEDEIAVLRADNARLRARQTVELVLPEQRENDSAAASYREMVNAPLRPETIEAIRQRIEAGDLPTRRVPRREPVPVMSPEQQARFDADHADGPTPGCDCGHDGMGRAWHARDCEWRAGVPGATTTA